MHKGETFLFVHGAWHASWCWNKIDEPIINAGHRVLTPDLPGHGSLTRPTCEVTLQDYVDSVIELVKAQPEPVTLIGHSMGGIILAQVAEHIPDHIKELVFLAAYIPQDGQSLFSMAQSSESRGVSPFLIIDKERQAICLQDSPELIDIFFNKSDRADAEFALAHFQAQPLEPFAATVKLGNHYQRVPKRALVCKDDVALVLNDQLKYCKPVTDNIIYLNADHSAYYSAADELVDIFTKAK